MIKYFERGNKEHLKRVLRKVYKCENVEQMSDDELASRILKIEDAVKHAGSFDEFKAFCLEGSDE